MTARWLRFLLLAQLATLLLLGAALAWFGHHWAGLSLAVLGLPLGYLMLTGVHVLLQAAWCGRHGAGACNGTQRWRIWLMETWLQMRAFVWLQAWREQAWPDHLIAPAQVAAPGSPSSGSGHKPGNGSGKPGVVLVHGYLCNRAFWNPLLRRLTALGTPYVAVNLEPMLSNIDAYAPIIDAAVARLASATGQPPVLLAHSMGGLAARAWLASGDDQGRRVAGVITVGSPHAGAWIARYANTPNALQMRPHSAWLRALQASEARQAQAPLWCIASDCDQLVYPPQTALLAGSMPVQVTGCGHLELAEHPATWHCLQRALAGAR